MPRIYQAPTQIVHSSSPLDIDQKILGVLLSKLVKHFMFLSCCSDGVVQSGGNGAVELCSIMFNSQLNCTLISVLLHSYIKVCTITDRVTDTS
jgi:hypothetical protein